MLWKNAPWYGLLTAVMALAGCADTQPDGPAPNTSSLRSQVRAETSLTTLSASAPTSDPSEQPQATANANAEVEEYEYIVVGSGAGGGPLAARLAEAGHRVLLLEAGENTGGNSLNYQIPLRHPAATEDGDLAWWYFVDHYDPDDPQALRDSKMVFDDNGDPIGLLYPRGGTLGGSTAVNAMITVLPKRSEWDDISALTDDASWRADNMDQYYARVREWLSVELPDPGIAIFDNKLPWFLAATAKVATSNPFRLPGILLGLLKGRDINEFLIRGGADIDDAMRQEDGVFSFPLARQSGNRFGVRERLLSVVGAGHPLTIKTQALVTKVVFDTSGDTPRATGVEFLEGRRLYGAAFPAEDGGGNPEPVQRTVTATREVILSAGAFNTPQLLMLSGIGPRDHLEDVGVPVVVDSPGVGSNLQDRYEVGVVSELNISSGGDDNFDVIRPCSYTDDSDDYCFNEWLRNRGVYTTNGSVVSILLRSEEEQARADLHIFGVPGVFKGYRPGYADEGLATKNHFTWDILKGHTENQAGIIRLRSSNPRDTPSINFRYFADTDQGQDIGELAEAGSNAEILDPDLRAMVNAVEFVRNLADITQAKLPPITVMSEVWPGRDVDSRAGIAQWVKDEAWGHHASCSAPIGADGDQDAVLDSNFQVRGTSGLRVVDASVFPRIPGTFIALPIYMVSEKAADVILDAAAQ